MVDARIAGFGLKNVVHEGDTVYSGFLCSRYSCCVVAVTCRAFFHIPFEQRTPTSLHRNTSNDSWMRCKGCQVGMRETTHLRWRSLPLGERGERFLGAPGSR